MATVIYEFEYEGQVLSIDLTRSGIYDLLIPPLDLAEYRSDQ